MHIPKNSEPIRLLHGFTHVEIALKAYESKEYQDALKVLDGGADRLYAVVEGY